MSVEFIGLVSARNGPEGGGSRSAPPIDRDWINLISRTHEEADFDNALIGYFASSPDGILVAAAAGAATEKLKLLIAHRPGFVSPTLAARKFATLDHLFGGRVTLNIVSGMLEADQHRDGDWLPHDDRYSRTDEYLTIMRQAWTSDVPFDFEGHYYNIKGGTVNVQPIQKPSIPLYISGASEGGVDVAAKHADTYMAWGEPIEDIRERIQGINEAAAVYGRKPGFSVSFRPVLGVTEEKAWEKAHAIAEKTASARSAASLPDDVQPDNQGSRRLLEQAAKGVDGVRDERLYFGVTTVIRTSGNTTMLVGTPDQVAESILQYIDAGATSILVRGFNQLEDTIEYGRDLIPIVRSELAHREHGALVAG